MAVLTIALCALIVGYGASRIPGGYDGGDGLNVTFGLLATIWALGFFARCSNPASKLAAATEAVALFVGICLIGSLASAALALGGGPYIDPSLVAIDRAIVPFAEWRDIALAQRDYPGVKALLSRFYVALNWQAFLLFAVALIVGRQRDMDALLTAFCAGLLICILPFHWLPALGPYAYYGIGQADIGGAAVILPWEFPVRLEELRSGQIDAIGLEAVSGLISIPSFHACSAVIFAWVFWRYRLLRWPMLATNVLMFVAAVPIGGHYFIDVVAGGAAGALAVLAARTLERRREAGATRRSRAARPRPALA